MDFDLRQLEIFVAVVEHGSFTRAADQVHLAQASVSERIANLERAVGTKLLDRMGRKAVPTAVGGRLYERAVELLRSKQDICLELEELLGAQRGSLRVGASTIPGEYILPGEIARFREHHPDLVIRVVTGDTRSVVDQVAAGEVEIGFVGSMLEHPNLDFQPLWDDELVLAVPAGHRWWGSESVGLEELSDEPFVIREPGSGTRGTMERTLGDAPLKVVAELGSTSAIKQAVVRGLGLSILSRRALKFEVEVGALWALRLEGLVLARSFHLVHDPRRSRSPIGQRFVDFVLS